MPATTLRALAKPCKLPIGTCVAMEPLANEPRYAEVLAREFDMCVAENAFKPQFVWCGPGEYDFTETDRLAAYARDHDLTLRGHTLVWHQGVPNWLRETNPAPSRLRDLLADYIHAMVGRYKGRIAMWDVVNEAFTDGDASDWRAESFWHERLGSDYLKLAFAWAREADPDAALYYNDYNAEELCPKSDRIHQTIRDLKAEGVPIDGIGFQGHLVSGWRAQDSHRDNIARFVALGLDWQFTECDIRIVLNGQPATPEQLAEQAAGYRDLIGLCRAQPRCKGFVTWGFTDKHSWIPGFRPGEGAALPLDEEYRPKPAYDAICAALRERAW